MNNFSEYFSESLPEIMTGAGLALLLIGGIAAGRATVKAEKKIKNHKINIEKLRVRLKANSVSNKEYRTEITKAYAKDAADISKDFIVPLALITVGAVLECKSDSTLRGRLSRTELTLNAFTTAFAAYQNRVKEKYGEQAESDIRNNIQRQIIEETVVDPVTGKKKKIKKEIMVNKPEEDGNPYRAVLKKGECDIWGEDQPIENVQVFLKAQQAAANEKLWHRAKFSPYNGYGYVWLNELRKYVGLKAINAGRDCGNIVDIQNPSPGDDFIDFGLFDPVNADFWASTNNNEKTDRVVLTFNCVGNIRPFLFDNPAIEG